MHPENNFGGAEEPSGLQIVAEPIDNSKTCLTKNDVKEYNDNFEQLNRPEAVKLNLVVDSANPCAVGMAVVTFNSEIIISLKLILTPALQSTVRLFCILVIHSLEVFNGILLKFIEVDVRDKVAVDWRECVADLLLPCRKPVYNDKTRCKKAGESKDSVGYSFPELALVLVLPYDICR